jgi:ribosomal protein L11 methyltransferase
MADQPTHLARLSLGLAPARTIADALGEVLDPDNTAIALVEQPDGQWAVEVNFAEAPDEADLRALVQQIAGEATAAALSFSTIAARDWVRQSLADLAPVVAGRFVVHGAHDRARVPRNAIAIEIEAALAFGTGHHGTTRGCLLALEAVVKQARSAPSLARGGGRRAKLVGRGQPYSPFPNFPRKRGRESILDLGTGSGVLAIAAAKGLRVPVIASDIDRVAVKAAKENARLNRAPRLTIVQAAGLASPRLRAGQPYALILGNILLAPLKRLARPLSRALAPGGRIILSGLLTAQANAALSAYRLQGLVLERRLMLDNWATLVMRRAQRTNGN